MTFRFARVRWRSVAVLAPDVGVVGLAPRAVRGSPRSVTACSATARSVTARSGHGGERSRRRTEPGLWSRPSGLRGAPEGRGAPRAAVERATGVEPA